MSAVNLSHGLRQDDGNVLCLSSLVLHLFYSKLFGLSDTNEDKNSEMRICRTKFGIVTLCITKFIL